MNQSDTETLPPAQRANDYLTHHRRFREPEMLFDEFWREGELALFFGAAGSGKSVFAVQLADALSRGGGLYGFRGPKGRRRVLYVDLRHTDEQFLMRCTDIALGGKRARPHAFPMNLFRERPSAGQDLCEWLRAYVTANRVHAVIIDDLSAVKNTHDGTRETLHLMRQLRTLRDELRISILVLADANEPPRNATVSEPDLGRSRVLCSVTDSVFAAGRNRKQDDDHYLVQTRSRSSRLFWTFRNAPTAQIMRNATGLLSFEFDDRFDERMSEEKRRLICKISRLQEVEFKSFREIAAELGISKSWACELYKKWTPAMESSLPDDGSNTTGRECAPYSQDWTEDYDHAADKEVWPDEKGGNTTGRECAPYSEVTTSTLPYQGGMAFRPGWFSQHADGASIDTVDQAASGEPPRLPAEKRGLPPNSPPVLRRGGGGSATPGWSRKEGSLSDSDDPQSEIPNPKSIHDLPLGHDGYGREIYIESRCHHTGKPAIWYQLDKKGQKRRFTRDTLGIQIEHLDAGPFL